MVDEFQSRRKLIIKLLSEIPGFRINEPEGAFYVFPDVSHYFGKTMNGKNINNLAVSRLKQAGQEKACELVNWRI